MKTHNLLYHFLFIFLIISFQSIAQKAGKPDYSQLSDEKKFAKKGHIPSMVTLGKVAIGTFFTEPERRDFLKGVEWIQKAQTQLDAAAFEDKGEFECFFATSLGGYGLPKDLGAAHTQLAALMAKRLDVRVFEDRPDLDLEKLRNLLHKAESGDANSMAEVGRMILEAHFDYNMGLSWLEKSNKKGNLEGGFLYEWWKKNSRSYTNENFYDGTTTQKWFEKGSLLATLQYISHEDNVEMKDLQKKINIITENDDINPEIRLKLLFQMQKKLKGKDRLRTLKKIELYATNIAAAPDYRFIEKISQEYFEMRKKARTIQGLQQLIVENPFLKDIPLNYEEYSNDFNGDIRPCLKLLDALMLEENDFLGEENLLRYRDSLLYKIPAIYEKANDEPKIMAFKNTIEERKELRKITAEFQHKIREKMSKMGVDVGKMDYLAELEKINQLKFKSFDEAKKVYDNIDNLNISSAYKKELKAFMKQKTVFDIFGTKPTRGELAKIESELPAQNWLYPEAKNLIANFRSNFLDKYEGAIRNGKEYYFYRLTRKSNSNDFDMLVYSVRDGKSNLVYKSSFSADFAIDSKIYLTVFDSKLNGYQWTESRSEFLQMKFDNGKINTFKIIGMEKHKSAIPTEKQINQNGFPNDFSAKGAFQAAMTYFLLGFTRALVI